MYSCVFFTLFGVLYIKHDNNELFMIYYGCLFVCAHIGHHNIIAHLLSQGHPVF